ncbi:hypothetical protein GCM10022284_44360 [Streptomyces hundungensis]
MTIMAETGRTVYGVFGPRLSPGGGLEKQRHGCLRVTVEELPLSFRTP